MDKLLEILKNLHEDVDYTTEDKLIDDGILDSFDIVSLVSEISEEFGVEITAEYLTPENFNSADAIYKMITELQSM